MQRMGHPSQDTSHFILHCSATDSLAARSGESLSLYDLWSRPRVSPILRKGSAKNNNSKQAFQQRETRDIELTAWQRNMSLLRLHQFTTNPLFKT